MPFAGDRAALGRRLKTSLIEPQYALVLCAADGQVLAQHGAYRSGFGLAAALARLYATTVIMMSIVLRNMMMIIAMAMVKMVMKMLLLLLRMRMMMMRMLMMTTTMRMMMMRVMNLMEMLLVISLVSVSLTQRESLARERLMGHTTTLLPWKK